jgi:hypothetical protein
MPGAWPIAAVYRKLSGSTVSEEETRRFSDAADRMQRRYKKLSPRPSTIGHLWLRDMLRRAWDAKDTRERDWYLFRFRDHYQQMVRRYEMTHDELVRDELAAVDVTTPRIALPPVDAIEAAAFYFQHQARRARHCENEDCPAPYFFISKKGQRYCSPVCSKPAQRAAKRRWWNENRATQKRRKKR